MSDNIVYKANKNGKIITIPPIKDLCMSLEEKFRMQEEEISYWKTKYNNAIDGNKEYQILLDEKKQLEERIHNGFDIFTSEKQAIDAWYKKHKKSHLTSHITYKFTPLGIGTVGTVECSCGESFIFRNID